MHPAQAHHQQQQAADARQNLNQLAGPSTASSAHPGGGRLPPPHSHPSAPTAPAAAGPSHLRAPPLPSPLYPLATQQNGSGGGGGSGSSSSSNDGAPVWGMQWQQPTPPHPTPPHPTHPQNPQHAHYQPQPHHQHQQQMYASPPTASSSSLPMYGPPPLSVGAAYRHARPMHPPPIPPPPPPDGSFSPAPFPPSLPSSSTRPSDDYRASAPPMAPPSLRPPTADYHAASVSSSPLGSPGAPAHALHSRSSSLVSPQPAYPSPLNPYHPPPSSTSSAAPSLRPPPPPVRSISTPVLPPARPALAPPPAFSAPPPPPPPLAGPEGAYYTFGSSGLVQADDESDAGFETVDAPSGAGGKRTLRTKVAAQKAVRPTVLFHRWPC